MCIVLVFVVVSWSVAGLQTFQTRNNQSCQMDGSVFGPPNRTSQHFSNGTN